MLCPSGPIQSQFPLTFEAIKQVRGWVQWADTCLPCPSFGVEEQSSSLSPVSLSVPFCCVPQTHGFVVYRTQLPWDVLEPAILGAPPHSVCDCGYVMLQQVRLQEHTRPWPGARGPCHARVSGTAGVLRATPSPCGVALWLEFAPFGGRGQPWASSGGGQAVGCYAGRLPAAFGAVGSGHRVAALILWLQEYRGTLERDGQTTLHMTGKAGDTLDVLLENMGRISFGANVSDFKVRGEGPGVPEGMAWPPTWPNTPSPATHDRPQPRRGHRQPCSLIDLTPSLGKPARTRTWL